MIHKTKSKKQKIFIIFMLLIIPIVLQAQTTIFVDVDANGNNDGSNWTNAYINLQYALKNAFENDDIWVADGTYYPDTATDNDRNSTFLLVVNVDVYGGFNGTESSLDQRKISVNKTILSGDLKQDDPSTSDNAYHVVTGRWATIDGFTITAGNANDGSDPNNKGGGIYNNSQSPDVINCTIKNNSATYGGGMCNDNSGPTIINCIFLNNSASQNGGGMYNSSSSPSLYNCTFSNNSASYGDGDGIYNITSPPNLRNCILWGINDQIYNSGGSNPSVTHSDVRVSGEVYDDGGGANDSLNININPFFKNANSNLLLKSGSPCFGTGTLTKNPDPDIPTTDKDGRPRPLPESDNRIDMGAYEQYDDGSLPVELFIFTASYEKRCVILSWKTESEVNNLGFILERKENQGEFTEIASYLTHDELKSQGNTSSCTEYEIIDKNVTSGKTYFYRISDVSIQGKVNVHPAISITLNDLLIETKLDNAYPNPFNPKTYIGYHLAEETRIKLTVMDMLGRKVKKLYDDVQTAGSYHVYWNGRDNAGYQCPSGVYIIQLQTASITKTKKVMLLK